MVRLTVPVVSVLLAGTLLSGCDQTPAPSTAATSALTVRQMQRLIPARVSERPLWAGDILTIMGRLQIPPTLENACSIVAVVDQESNFIANPAVPGLGEKAMREINERLTSKFGPLVAGQFEKMLAERPTPEQNFEQRLRAVSTERDLDLVYREIFEYFKSHYRLGVLTGAARLVVGQDLSEYFNPVKTLGSMQVHINHALANPEAPNSPTELRDLLYTRPGGLYYGIHRLMAYPAAYPKPIYRFADYNSGLYSSRNAAFQHALNALSGEELDLDGDLLLYGKDGDALSDTSSTELALRRYLLQRGVVLGDAALRRDLLKEKQADFEQTLLWRQIEQDYQQRFGKKKPYAIMPEVRISGPKLSRDYNTQWYANSVNRRFERCRSKGRRMGLD